MAQKLRHPFVGLRRALKHHHLLGLLEAGQVHALGHEACQIGQKKHGQIAVGLQIFYRFLARLKGCNFGFLSRNALNLLLQLLNFRLQHLVLGLLVAQLQLQPQVHHSGQHHPHQARTRKP